MNKLRANLRAAAFPLVVMAVTNVVSFILQVLFPSPVPSMVNTFCVVYSNTRLIWSIADAWDRAPMVPAEKEARTYRSVE